MMTKEEQAMVNFEATLKRANDIYKAAIKETDNE